MTFQKSTAHIVLITIITLIMATCIVSIYFQEVNAQYYRNDDNDIKLEPIRHMMDRRHHMTMEDGQQEQESSMSNFSMTRSNKITTADGDNILYASIVIGAISRTTDAYQPNPIYLKEDKMVVWTNNDYNLHTVTQGPLSVGIDTALRFDSGILSRGQSFSYIFDKEGTYNYYCTIHPWMVGQVVVITNSTTVPALATNNQSASISMLERGGLAMGFNQNKILHQFKSTLTGGEILITALNNSDIETIKQIKNHIYVIQKEFSAGNFTKPFYIHTQDVPGTKLMSEKKNFIEYNINEINNGGTLILETKDKELLAAIHQFITFQNTEHYGH